MAPSMRDLLLTAVNGVAADVMEDVRLLDSYEDRTEDNLLRIEEGMKIIQDEEDIKNAIEDAGFEAEILTEPCSSGSKPHKIQLWQFTIGGMTCAACVNSVEGILRDLHGVKRAVVALATALGEVEYDSTVISKDDIINAIEDAGFEGSFVQSSEQDKIVLGVTGVFCYELDVQFLEGILINLKGPVSQYSCLFHTSDLSSYTIVTTAKVFVGIDRGEFLTLVASAEASSEHPLGRAIVEYAQSTVSGWLHDVSNFSALPGRGVQCFINGKGVLVGNRKLMTEIRITIPTHVENFVVELEESAETGILVAYDNNLIGVLGVADPLKREAAVVLEGLVKMGVRPIMVTGDNWRTARVVAKEFGIQDVTKEVMPAGKADVIRSFQNDGRTDIAIEAADYVLMRSNLEDVVTAIDISRKTFHRIRLNYVFAMTYNVIAIPVAAGVFFPSLGIILPPWAAGACMALSSVSVVCSSLLLRRYKKPRLTTILQITVE
ncbi:hypothetical protein EZV62_003346 [Acer yangbiense]|uniref:HMA domain-containing protein n=1 Tax=Acer yangbiense TaxID=1000413 RepID=A0A5C7IGZ8_9ROSI|nr:hypothetical protein EZV62_003346 [Acer yangbiense]